MPLAFDSPSPRLLLALVAASALLSAATARSFVALDRATSCVQQFGCSADFVGFIMEVESVAQCQKWCDQHPSCNYFTWRNSSIFTNFCFMMAECGDLDFECVDCFSGPKTAGCPLRRRNF